MKMLKSRWVRSLYGIGGGKSTLLPSPLRDREQNRSFPFAQFLVSLFYDLPEGNYLMATLINQFTWIPIYQELAQELARWENRQDELVSFLEELRSEGYVITPLHDKDADGARFVLREIDPFPFFGVFNRRIGYDQRLAILSQIKQRFGLQKDLPEDFN